MLIEKETFRTLISTAGKFQYGFLQRFRINWFCQVSLSASIHRLFDVLRVGRLPVTLNLYSLRHSCATLLLSAGVNPKIVSERLGHSSIVLTLDVYSHVLPSMQQTAAEKLESLLFRRA